MPAASNIYVILGDKFSYINKAITLRIIRLAFDKAPFITIPIRVYQISHAISLAISKLPNKDLPTHPIKPAQSMRYPYLK